MSGRIRPSVCRWCYPDMDLDDLAREAEALGIESIELLGEHEWDVVKRRGLTCAMATGPCTIADGWNDPRNHDRLVMETERLLPLIAAAGLPNMLVFSGSRRSQSDADGLRHCAEGLGRILPLAEKLGVTVCMELLNSKIDHPDYQCDHTAWGVALCEAVASDRFKLLYDIYHMQIMEGDIIRTFTDNIRHIGHFHTGGVPGRNEIDHTQELNYPRICQAIVEAGYTGFMAQEFVPLRDPLTSLREAVRLCTV